MVSKPIEITSHIASLIDSNEGGTETLNKICSYLHKSLKCNIVSIYRNDQNYHTLIANSGFNKEHIGKLHIKKGKGLVHHIIETNKTLCLRDAASHHAFYYVHGLGEERFHGFIGSPILKKGKAIGCLIVQYTRNFDSSLEDIALMETLSHQISSLVITTATSSPKKDENSKHSGLIYARGVVPGYFHGKVIKKLVLETPHQSPIKSGKGYKIEKKRLEIAHQKSKKFLEEMKKSAKTREGADILSSHLVMLSDPKLLEKEDQYLKENASAEQAVNLAVHDISQMFEQISDPYIRQRSLDVVDVGRRLYQTLSPLDEKADEVVEEKAIYIANKLPPSVLIEEGPKKYGALLLVEENLYSHNIILAKSMNIPTVIISKDQLMSVFEKKKLFVDGELGLIVPTPSKIWIDEYLKTHHEAHQTQQKELGPCISKNGIPITIAVNGGFLKDVTNLPNWITEIGLFRTEFHFFTSPSLPSEEELTENYLQILKAAGPRPVILRILDTGADKQPPCMPLMNEDNPVLGNRSIRFLLRDSSIFFMQLRAMLKAQYHSGAKLKILIPMVSIYEEVSRIRDHLFKVLRDLAKDDIFIKRPPLGVMLEVPSSVQLIPKLSSIVDFFCVGTNDLLQYYVAADRTNQNVQYLCRWHHPSFLQILQSVVKSCTIKKRPLSTCGEMAGELWGSLVLLGLGFKNLSMDRSSAARHHELISKAHTNQLEKLAQKLINCNTSVEVLEQLQLFLDRWQSLQPDLKEIMQSELNSLINS